MVSMACMKCLADKRSFTISGFGRAGAAPQYVCSACVCNLADPVSISMSSGTFASDGKNLYCGNLLDLFTESVHSTAFTMSGWSFGSDTTDQCFSGLTLLDRIPSCDTGVLDSFWLYLSVMLTLCY